MRCTSSDTHVFTAAELNDHDSVVAEEFTEGLQLLAETSHTLKRVLGEEQLYGAVIGGSSYCAGFIGEGHGDWMAGMLSPEEMTINMVVTILKDRLEGSI